MFFQTVAWGRHTVGAQAFVARVTEVWERCQGREEFLSKMMFYIRSSKDALTRAWPSLSWPGPRAGGPEGPCPKMPGMTASGGMDRAGARDQIRNVFLEESVGIVLSQAPHVTDEELEAQNGGGRGSGVGVRLQGHRASVDR